MNTRSRIALSGRNFLLRSAVSVLILALVGGGFYQFWLCSLAGSPLTAIHRFLLGLILISAASLLLVRLCVPAVANRLAFGLLFPRNYLKEAPISLSPVQGLMAAGRFREAEEQLVRLSREHPGNAQIALLLLNLYENRLGQHQSAVETAENYLTSGAARPGPDHFRLLMRYADFLQGTEREKELEERLNFEIKHWRLTASESAAVHARLAALHRNQSGGK